MPIENRIAKEIARRGYCSRRDAEKLIAQGVVYKDGVLVTHPSLKVTSDCHIKINDQTINRADRTRVWLYNKPRGLITTHRDPQGRKTVFEVLPSNMPHVMSVGRLDCNSEGLLILTNNGEWARALELPQNGIQRVYKCRAYGRIPKNFVQELAKGCLIASILYNPIKVELLDNEADINNLDNHWMQMTLTEGKNREIRRICEHFGLRVNRLIRVRYGRFVLGDIKSGEVREVKYDD